MYRARDGSPLTLVGRGNNRLSTGPIICVGASTGGVQAIERVLSGLPKECPPVFIVQHMLPRFSRRLADRFGRNTGVQVVTATDGMIAQRGQVAVAPPGDMNLCVARNGATAICRLSRGRENEMHCPSVDTLFFSAAASGLPVVAAVLTGMGKDGAKGLKEIRRTGGHTIAQDESSSLVWGMPGAAVALGAAQHVIPLERIPTVLIAMSSQIGGKR